MSSGAASATESSSPIASDAAPRFEPAKASEFVDPGDGGRLIHRIDGVDEYLTVDRERSDKRYPIVRGVPRFVEREDYVASFGFQWNRFEVMLPQEDFETFEVKTGVNPTRLSGLRVLDAGCGGGRYSRVAGEHGAEVVALDRSEAVEKARALTGHLPNVTVAQADLVDPPVADRSFDLVFSIGVLHHSPDARRSFESIARKVKPGGRLSVWLYKRCLPPLEWINDALRSRTTQMKRDKLVGYCEWAGTIGGIPIAGKMLNKVVSFSCHPVREIRVCDTYDWYAPRYQSHHRFAEAAEWYRQEGFDQIEELPPAKRGRAYRLAHRLGLLMGSGVNVTGVKIG